jgi:hypothetical protein
MNDLVLVDDTALQNLETFVGPSRGFRAMTSLAGIKQHVRRLLDGVPKAS